MAAQTLGLSPDLLAYLRDHTLREAPWLTQLRQETATRPGATMQIAPEQGQWMSLLVQLMGARKALEVGVFTGYSALVVALALPPDGTLVACDVDAETAAIAQRYWQAAGVADKITLHLGPAVDTLDRLLAAGEANSFDFAFIDADKRNYPRYYEQALHLVRPGGLILIDNVLWSGEVANPDNTDPRVEAIRSVNDQIHHDQRVDACLVPIADGVMMIRKR